MTTAPSPRILLLPLLLGSAAVILAALGFQYIGGLAPCELCLYERWPYYAAIVFALLGIAGSTIGARLAIAATVLLFGASAILAFYHVGVEQHWFAGPTACTGSVGGAASIEELKRQLVARQPVNCDEAAWRLFGVSLAGWNLLASLALFALGIGGLRQLPTRGGAR
ncbi:MAG: disulfide bond formation protein [Rhodospirillales bacterium]|jgi:disulfide bond formation protein DsbB|nr:disulfide bond formation protein [Rhodospirillales bacterium]